MPSCLRCDVALTICFFVKISGCRIGSEGGPSDPLLKKWWRGRMGMDTADQQQFYECGCLPGDEETAIAAA